MAKVQPVTVKCLHLPLRGGGRQDVSNNTTNFSAEKVASYDHWFPAIEASPASKIKTLSNEKPWWV